MPRWMRCLWLPRSFRKILMPTSASDFAALQKLTPAEAVAWLIARSKLTKKLCLARCLAGRAQHPIYRQPAGAA